MFKVKHERKSATAWWPAPLARQGGTARKIARRLMLLGLYDDASKLQHVGVAASFTAAKRVELVELLAPYRQNALVPIIPGRGVGCRAGARRSRPPRPGGEGRTLEPRGRISRGSRCAPSWWSEVAYEHMQGSRFRHTAHFRRWRSDKNPHDCTYEQLEVVAPHELAAIFAASR